jgi:biopolymer transport protein ExbB/TolQ
MEILLGTIIGFVITILGAYLAFRVFRKFNDLESTISNEVSNLYRVLEDNTSNQDRINDQIYRVLEDNTSNQNRINDQIYTQFDNERRELDSRLDKLENRLTQKLKYKLL